MPPIYYVGQVCAVAAWIMLLISYHAKRENKVIFLQIISSVLYIVNYYCVGAVAGLWISVFELVKSIGYYKTDKDRYIFYYTLPIYLVILCFTGFDVVSLLAVFGSVIDGYVMLKSKRTMVVGGIISYALWVVYDLCFFDFANAVSDMFIVVSNVSILVRGYNKYLHRSNIYTVKSLRISMSTVHEIDKLDRKALDGEYRWDEETIKELTKDHKYSYILVKDENKVIGYVNFLNLKEDVYEKMLNSYDLYDDFAKEDIAEFTKNRKAYLNLNAIVLNDDYFNSDTIYKIENAIKRYIRTMRKNRYYIQELCCFAVSPLEFRVLEDLKFEKVRDITNECCIYRKII
ncbi:YgjV family protein [Candidatus Saccharibacteria bacterium]|nr:YgjV family protein [Candidatus Saccharibacteria bacterium]